MLMSMRRTGRSRLAPDCVHYFECMAHSVRHAAGALPLGPHWVRAQQAHLGANHK